MFGAHTVRKPARMQAPRQAHSGEERAADLRRIGDLPFLFRDRIVVKIGSAHAEEFGLEKEAPLLLKTDIQFSPPQWLASVTFQVWENGGQ